MIRIVNGLRYDTEKATIVAESVHHSRFVPAFLENSSVREALYETKKGNYFILIQGVSMGINLHSGFSSDTHVTLKPISKEKAKTWLEETENFEILEELFPGEIEDA